MWFLSPEQQKEQAALAQAVAGPMRAWWRRNRLFWIIAIAILAALLLADPLAGWLLQPAVSTAAPYAPAVQSYAVAHWLEISAFYVYPVLVIAVLLLWWLAALRVNRVLDALVAEAALPHSPLITLVRLELALRQGLVPLLSIAIIRSAHALLGGFSMQLQSGEPLAISPDMLANVSYLLLWLFQLPVIMVWALALLAVLPRKPVVGALLPTAWLLVNPLAYLPFATYPVTGGFLPDCYLDQPWNYGFLYARELTPAPVAYGVYFAVGLGQMLLAIGLARWRTWIACIPLSIQLLFVATASYAAKLLRLDVADPKTALPGGLLAEALQRVGAVAYQPIVTSTSSINLPTPALFIGIRSLAWTQLFADYPLPIMLVAIAINVGWLLLLKELVGWVLYRAELGAASKSNAAFS